jgi:hypothetical protein
LVASHFDDGLKNEYERRKTRGRGKVGKFDNKDKAEIKDKKQHTWPLHTHTHTLDHTHTAYK